MRNLKRALSLAMASVMLLGMMVVGTGASYADVDSADNVEAIEVMQAIGVMVGDTNGNFNPDQKVTRVEMAVVMANLLDLKVEDFVGAKTPFTDVPEWAVPYVAACYADGITAGISATQYGSNYEVTTAQAALMMMKALGYFQNAKDFGSDWQVATVKQGSKIDLFDGVKAGASSAMTRNDVAQIALNTLEATMVETDGNSTDITLPGDISISTGDTKYVDVTSKSDYAGAFSDEADKDGNYTVQLGEKLFDGDLEKLAKKTDSFGRPAHVWEYKGDEVVTAADEADDIYVVDDTKLTLGSILTDDDYFDYSTSDANVDKATYVQNGQDSDKDHSLQKGDIVEVFEDKDGKVEKVVAIRYTAAKIDEVSQDLSSSEEKAGASYSIDLVEVNNDGNSIGAGTYYDDYNKDNEILNGFSANTYKEGTVLAVALSAKDGRTILGSYVADIATGTVSSYKADDYVTVGGTKYTMAGTVDGIKADFSFEDEYNLYLTADGYVIAVDGAAEASINDVYYVTGVYMSKSNMGTQRYYAQTVALDGTIKEIQLENSEFESDGAFVSNKPSDSGEFKAIGALYTLTDKANGDDKSGDNKFNAVKFDGNESYTVKAEGTLSSSVAKDDTNMTVDGTKVYMNKDTKYIAVEKSGDDIDVATAVGGMKCAQKDATNVLVISNKDDSRTAVYVIYVGNDLSSSVVSDDVVYVAEKSDEQNADGWVTTLYFMNNNSIDDVTVDTQVEPGFYYYDVDEDDVYSLEGVTGLGNDKVDDDTNGWDALVINEDNIYGTQNLLTKDNFSDIAFGGAKVIDSRSSADIKADLYDKEITSVSALKNAAKEGYVSIRVYVTDGEITFIDVIAMDGVLPDSGAVSENIGSKSDLTATSVYQAYVEAAKTEPQSYQWLLDLVDSSYLTYADVQVNGTKITVTGKATPVEGSVQVPGFGKEVGKTLEQAYGSETETNETGPWAFVPLVCNEQIMVVKVVDNDTTKSVQVGGTTYTVDFTGLEF